MIFLDFAYLIEASWRHKASFNTQRGGTHKANILLLESQ